MREQQFRLKTTWDNFHRFALYREIWLGQYINKVWKITWNRGATARNFMSSFIGHIYCITHIVLQLVHHSDELLLPYISLLNWRACLKMTLMECQSPWKARSRGNGIPCKTEQELNEASPAKSSSSLPQRCLLGKYPPPFKTSFPSEECYPPTASGLSFPVCVNSAPGPTPAGLQLISIPEGILPAQCTLELHKEKGKRALPSFQAEEQLNYHHPEAGERDFKIWGAFW